jgi:hypothetical protein
MGIILLGGAVVFVLVVVKHRRYVKRVEAARDKKVAHWMKQLAVVDKKDVWSGDPTGASTMGSFSVVYDDQKDNCSSIDALVGEKADSFVDPPETEAEKKIDHPNPAVVHNALSDPIPQYSSNELNILATAPSESTTSLNFLVDGISCVSPFEKEVVDTRDSLMNYVVGENENLTFGERVDLAIKTFSDVARGCIHILEMGKEGEKFLYGLSPSGIVKAPDDEIIIVTHSYLM